jgi:hypothetical protein
MLAIEKCPVPVNALLNKYSMPGAYVDCYTTEVPGHIPFPEYIFAFYTTFLFKLERWILQLTVSKPSTDVQARQLADGHIEKFAVWQVESRSENEILLCDLLGRTRSWLMSAPMSSVYGHRTRLHFGSAVVPARNSKTGKLSLGFGFQALFGFHRIYSMLLLYFAATSLKRQFHERSHTLG